MTSMHLPLPEVFGPETYGQQGALGMAAVAAAVVVVVAAAVVVAVTVAVAVAVATVGLCRESQMMTLLCCQHMTSP